MALDEIEQALLQTFEDCRLSKNEKIALEDLLANYSTDYDVLNFARNKAFDLVREHFNQTSQYHRESLKWLERVIKAVDSQRSQEHVASQSYFSPGDKCLKAILGLIRSAKSSIDVCVFTISDDRISKELASAFHRDVEVRIITDNDKSADQGSDVRYFAELGMAVKTDDSPSHMHHKFAVFDNRILVNGSFNWTRSASKYNSENIVVSYEADLLDDFIGLFKGLWGSDAVKPYQK